MPSRNIQFFRRVRNEGEPADRSSDSVGWALLALSVVFVVSVFMCSVGDFQNFLVVLTEALDMPELPGFQLQHALLCHLGHSYGNKERLALIFRICCLNPWGYRGP